MKELHGRRQKEDEEKEIKVDNYRGIGLWLKNYSEEELREVKKLISCFIKLAKEVEEVIILYSIELARLEFSIFFTFVNGTLGCIYV